MISPHAGLTPRTRVKICGITDVDDAQAAVEAGADGLGFVFAESPRRIDPAAAERIIRALPPLVSAVGVFVDAAIEEVTRIAAAARLDVVQLHGGESPEYCQRLGGRVIKRLMVESGLTRQELRERGRAYPVSALLLDPGAGSGRVFDWSLAEGWEGRLVLSGGLTTENVGAAIRRVRPYAVDVSSGVERAPGRKDIEKMRAFVRAARDADAGGPA